VTVKFRHDRVFFAFGETQTMIEQISMEMIMLVGFGIVAIALIVLIVMTMRQANEPDVPAENLLILKTQLDALTQHQQTLQAALNEQLNVVSNRLGKGMSDNAEKTAKSLGALTERLKVIDAAQENIKKLSGDVIGLQDILSNKQARGAFGEIQLEDLVRGTMPPNAYEFQSTLSNGRRPDCIIRLPNPPGSIVIDAKFPLESYRAIQSARSDDEIKVARRGFSADILKHVADISEKYILAGETADTAMMFIPAEAVHAELYANFEDTVKKAYQAKVVIVSPNTLYATLNTMRAVLRDAQMREQAGLIQKAVATLLTDVGRLDDRVGKLQSHFQLAEKDIREIQISTQKITRQGERIEEIDVEDDKPDLSVVTGGKA
jgi:DNA recombination protein RmuC